MELTLTLPAVPENASESSGAGFPLSLNEIADRLSRSLSNLDRDAQGGDEVARIVVELFHAPPARVSDMARRVAQEIERNGAGAETASGPMGGLATPVYAAASQAVEAGAFEEAALGLSALMTEPTSRSRALLGLSVCAARLERFDEALRLALESQAADEGAHPRAYYVAGLAECLRGNRREAQTHLVRASRLARRTPGFGEDLRMAQRLLLLMQIGLSEKTRL